MCISDNKQCIFSLTVFKVGQKNGQDNKRLSINYIRDRDAIAK
jgi:hypothetical protein